MAVRSKNLEEIVELETRKRNPHDYWNIWFNVIT